jgi:hypothetical protein
MASVARIKAVSWLEDMPRCSYLDRHIHSTGNVDCSLLARSVNGSVACSALQNCANVRQSAFLLHYTLGSPSVYSALCKNKKIKICSTLPRRLWWIGTTPVWTISGAVSYKLRNVEAAKWLTATVCDSSRSIPPAVWWFNFMTFHILQQSTLVNSL